MSNYYCNFTPIIRSIEVNCLIVSGLAIFRRCLLNFNGQITPKLSFEM